MLHQIGVGALGPVFRTYEPTRDRLVAVKVFRLDVIPEQARALADELARAADAGLFHPSIVEPLAAGLEGTVAYRAEEYVAAESLDVAMRHYAPATVDKMLPFITQLASALDFARAAGVGHGALHPRDIFVTPDEARATGFGVVDALERLGLRAPVRRPYSPPERIAGQPWGTPADVFSLGVIAFELLTGRRPSGLGAEMGPLTGAALGEREGDVRAVLARAMHADPGGAIRDRTGLLRGVVGGGGCRRDAGVSGASLHPASGQAVGRAGVASGRAPAPLSVDVESPLAAGAPVAQSVDDSVGGNDAGMPGASLAAEVDASDGELALDDFAAEAEAPSLSDSPREVARKVIAAREVRKRQVKKKAPEPAPDLISGLTADEALPAEILAAEPPLVVAEETSDGVVEPVLDVPIVGDSMATAADDVIAAPLLEAVELTPQVRDLSDRVVAVDEFRAREASNSKPERAWPRVPERLAFDKPLEMQRPETERAVPDRPEWAATSKYGAPSILSTPIPSVPSAIDEPLAVEGLSPSYDEPARDQPRLAILPIVLWVLLGIALGYPAGYIRGNREPPTVTATAPPPAERHEATSGSATTSVTVPPPPTVPAKPSEATPSVPAAAPAGGAKVEAPAPPPSRAPKPVATTGRIVITSSPAKAAVTINGKWSGRTPLTVDDLKFGKYVVRVVQPGFEVARKEVALSSSAPSGTFDTTLRPAKAPARAPAPEAKAAQAPPPASPASSARPPAATTGEIYVDSRPRGARVFIDGKEVGVTPVQLTAQPPGRRVVRLELVDHQPWTETRTVVAGELARVTGSLERIR